jgi:hypothetical protein
VATLTSDQLADLRSDIGVRDNIQQVTITGSTSGTFTLTYRSATTSSIAYDASASTVQSALEALPTIGTGNAKVIGSAGGPYKVAFASESADLLVADATGLTGGSSPAVSVEYVSIFSDARLNRNYTRAEGDYDLAVVITLRQLLASKSDFDLWTAGQSDEAKQDKFNNVEKLLDRWEDIAGVDGGSLSAGTLSLGLDMTEDDVEAEQWS